MFLQETRGENAFPCFFQLQATHILWLMPPPSTFMAFSGASSNPSLSVFDLCFHPHITFSYFDPLASLLEGPLGSHWAQLDNPG